MAGLTKWLNKMVKICMFLILPLSSLLLSAQENKPLSLEEAFHLAQQNYPLIHQKDLIKQSEKLSLANINSNFLPQLIVSGQATYQSDVTKVSIPLPGLSIPSQSKDQYKAIGEVNQLLYDGGLTKGQKNIQQLNSNVEENRLAVELYNLKARINQLYFSILFQDQLLAQTDLVSKDIQAGIDKVKPQVENGVALRSNLQLLQAQLLQTQQRAIEIKSARKGLANALSLLINQPISETTKFQLSGEYNNIDTLLNRPELKLYESQSQLIAGQEDLIHARNLPKASAFFQGGYGKPGLNMLSNDFKTFYITGIRLNWSLGSLYNNKRDKQLIKVNQQTVDLQKQVFVLNTQSQLKQQQSDIDKYAQLVATDNGIIQLRKSITDAAKAQLENAVITANDYLMQVNAEDQARQALILHQLQLRQAQINYAISTGKL
ncbi:MAG TPA: TolC family protein [Flavisolibacter sp.]|jgi:outer membrane protein TolC|nr:TolC family protein [Flavisolibacter sp.]